MSAKKTESLVPKLRFPQFQEEGEWDRLDGQSLFEQISDKNHDGDLPVLAITQEFGAIPRDLIDYNVSVSEKSVQSYKIVRVGDFIISLRSFQGGIEYSEYEGICSPAYVILREKRNTCSEFVRHFLKSSVFIRELTKNLEGLRDGKMISYKQFSELTIALPSKAEQQKIADCLRSLDELIAAHSAKLDALQDHKKGLLQNLFPAEGKTTPKLRFPEFKGAGEWKERKLSGFIAEKSVPASQDVPLYSLTIEDGVTPKTKRYERSFLVSSEADAYKLVEQNDFAFNPMNLRFGAIARYAERGNVALSKYYNIFSCDSTIDSVFFELYLRSKSMISFFDKMAEGSLIEKRRVHFANFLEFRIPIPRLEEQNRIAKCLNALDTQIRAQAGQIAALEKHKSGLMQQLFPNPKLKKA